MTSTLQILVNLAISCFLLSAGSTTASATSGPQYTRADSLAAFRGAVEAAPDSLSFHQQYIAAVGIKDPALISQYEQWSAQFKTSATVPYALGKALSNKYSPNAKHWLLIAVSRDPQLADAWQSLSFDAERWGNEAAATQYMGKASAAAPENPDYAFYYASSHKHLDKNEYRTRMLDIVKRFPESERAPQALYWLAHETQDTDQKIAYYTRSQTEFPPEKFRWSSSSMSAYYQLLLETSPVDAAKLAKQMTAIPERGEQWEPQLKLAEQLAEGRRLIDAGKGEQAVALMKQVTPGRIYGIKETVVLMATEALAAAGNLQGAQDSLLLYYCEAPSDAVYTRLIAQGKQLGLDSAAVARTILSMLEYQSVQATPFTLDQYLAPETIALEDLKGKVVLLTYWFPGCGPCRGEFPHLENVLRRFDRNEVIYLGINIARDQDPYVEAFMDGTGHTFIPLKEQDNRIKGNLDNRGAAPANFVINREGKVVFSNFMINANNERTLERMIEAVL